MTTPATQDSEKKEKTFSLNATRSTLKGKVVSHLFGLDSKQPTSGKWVPSISGLKISDALQGITLTPNFMFLLLFLGFFAWLFVLYWVRHNEPLADSVLGTPRAHSSTAKDDRRLVAGIKKVLPVRTSKTTGDFYVPGGSNEVHPEPHSVAHFQPVPASQPLASHPVYGSPANHDSMSATSTSGPILGHSSFDRHQGATSGSGHFYIHPRTAGIHHGSAYSVGVHTDEGPRLKTIVSR